MRGMKHVHHLALLELGRLVCGRYCIGQLRPDARPIVGAELLPGDFPAALTLDKDAKLSGSFSASREDLVEVLVRDPALLRQDGTLSGRDSHASSYRNARSATSVSHSVRRLLSQSASDNRRMDPQVEALKRLCDAHGGYQAVADAIQANRQTIYQIYAGIKLPSGNPRGVGPELRRKIAARFPNWLEDGPMTANIQPVTRKGRVPLISWVIAGNLEEIQDMYQPGEADEWIDAWETKPGANSFALKVSGDSMTSPYPGERSFPDGTIIIVDPGRACDAGDYVVAKDVATQQATFKRLAHDGGRWFLKPLNPTYPILEIDDPALRVIGRVIEFRFGGKL